MLNNKGWGLSTFLGFSLIFVLAIIIASVNAYKIGLNEKKESNVILNSNNFNYVNAESTLLNAGKRYFEVNNDVNIVTLTELVKDNYLANIVDDSNNTCTGYVKKDIRNYSAYIKCGNKYKSNGYVEEFDV